MKRILFLTFYFEPDLCAGSFRNSPLAKELSKQANGKAEIEVITTMPNRYSSFSAACPETEERDNMKITRVMLPKHKNGFIDQIFSFAAYYREVLRVTKGKNYDLVYASSSRLFTAYLGYKLSKKNKASLYLDIRDIFVDTIKDVISNPLLRLPLLPLLKYIERIVFESAKHINLISGGFQSYFKKYSRCNYSFFTNGIDEEFIVDKSTLPELPSSPIIITYAGNLGEGQGLHKIIPAVAKDLGKGYQFVVIGDGGARKLLQAELERMQLENVTIMNPVKRDQLIEMYKKSHFLFMHLNDYAAFEKVLPSKVFEMGAFPRPIIAGVDGFARIFIENNLPDALLFQPTNVKELETKLRSYKVQLADRQEFISKFRRNSINKEMASSILSYL